MNIRKRNVFPEIKTEYDYFVARFEDREIRLLYRIRQYSLVPENKVDNYRRNKVTMKRQGNPLSDGTVEIRYYQLYAVKQISLKSKRWLIDKILSTKVKGHNITLEDKIEDKWQTKNAHKTTTTPLMDREARLLDILANYYLGGVEGEGVLTMDMSRTIEKREIVTIAGMMNSDEENNVTEFSSQAKNRWEFRRMSKEKRRKVKKDAPARWKNSRTYKMNDIYSKIIPETPRVKNWKTQEKGKPNEDYHYNIDRLINPTRFYESKWFLVNTSNEFIRKGITYTIDKSVKEYKKVRDYYKMDKILVVEQDSNTYYFDQDIDPIPTSKIHKGIEVD